METLQWRLRSVTAVVPTVTVSFLASYLLLGDSPKLLPPQYTVDPEEEEEEEEVSCAVALTGCDARAAYFCLQLMSCRG